MVLAVVWLGYIFAPLYIRTRVIHEFNMQTAYPRGVEGAVEYCIEKVSLVTHRIQQSRTAAHPPPCHCLTRLTTDEAAASPALDK